MNHHLVLNSYSNQGLITFISRLNVTISIGFQSIHRPAKAQLSRKTINKQGRWIDFVLPRWYSQSGKCCDLEDMVKTPWRCWGMIVFFLLLAIQYLYIFVIFLHFRQGTRNLEKKKKIHRHSWEIRYADRLVCCNPKFKSKMSRRAWFGITQQHIKSRCGGERVLWPLNTSLPLGNVLNTWWTKSDLQTTNTSSSGSGVCVRLPKSIRYSEEKERDHETIRWWHHRDPNSDHPSCH